MKAEGKQANHLLVALAAGVFLGVAVFDTLPEAAEHLGLGAALLGIVGGVALWWVQKIALNALRKPDLPPLVATALWFHSVLEGVVTALSFGVSPTVGWLALTAMILHLLPEFFAAVALLLGSGARRRTSVVVPLVGFAVLFASFASTYQLLPSFGQWVPLLIALSGGAFLYIGAVSVWRRRSVSAAIACAIGIALAFLTS